MLMMRCALVTGVKTCALPISFEFVEQRAENHRPGRTERMAEGDRATVDVDFVRVDLQIADRAQHDGGKGLVDLEQIDIRRVHAGLLPRLERGWGAAGSTRKSVG